MVMKPESEPNMAVAEDETNVLGALRACSPSTQRLRVGGAHVQNQPGL